MAVDQGLTDARQVLAQPYPMPELINSVKFENFLGISGEIFLRNSQEFLGAKFLKNS